MSLNKKNNSYNSLKERKVFKKLISGLSLGVISLAGLMVFLTPSPELKAGSLDSSSCLDGDFETDYYNNRAGDGEPIIQTCIKEVDFFWGREGSPHPFINKDNFRSEWKTSVNLEQGLYNFTIAGDDKIELFINDQSVGSAVWQNGFEGKVFPIELQKGRYEIKAIQVETNKTSFAKLNWEKVDTEFFSSSSSLSSSLSSSQSSSSSSSVEESSSSSSIAESSSSSNSSSSSLVSSTSSTSSIEDMELPSSNSRYIKIEEEGEYFLELVFGESRGSLLDILLINPNFEVKRIQEIRPEGDSDCSKFKAKDKFKPICEGNILNLLEPISIGSLEVGQLLDLEIEPFRKSTPDSIRLNDLNRVQLVQESPSTWFVTFEDFQDFDKDEKGFFNDVQVRIFKKQSNIEDSCGKSPFIVTTTADNGEGSLREAIKCANSNNNPEEVDTINFNIPQTDSGFKTEMGVEYFQIMAFSEYDQIIEPLAINGRSQPEYGNGGLSEYQPVIEITGQVETSQQLMHVRRGPFSIEGLVFNYTDNNLFRATFLPVLIEAVETNNPITNIKIENNYFGTDITGKKEKNPTSQAVELRGVQNYIIGGSNKSQSRNIFVADFFGITVGNTQFGKIENNHFSIGLNLERVNSDFHIDGFYGIFFTANGSQDVLVTTNLFSQNLEAIFADYEEGLEQNERLTFSQNSMFGNYNQGISFLKGTSFNLNDIGDIDEKLANIGMNYPVFNLALFDEENSTLAVRGCARPGSLVEVYLADPVVGNYGEGKQYLGQIEVTDLDNVSNCEDPSDSAFFGTIDVSNIPAEYLGGAMLNFKLEDSITATATDDTGNTSEFGPNFKITF